ncbi:chemotaxis protein CheW [Oscillatoria sp. HE19RPO]|uniref:chemotaxis protein CheW n=1 Tax=Oscillatoria sp. HE19RPO TaxID=2954806 RepID=UPI0020C3D9FE|nr:chemotaxis protein CheW [Oscillatoria sp. HE19RPO]
MLRTYAGLQLSPKVQVMVPIEQVIEEITLSRRQICPIPGVPEAILGVVNTGGKLLWVIDLADFLTEVLGLTRRSPSRVDELTLVVIRKDPTPEPDPQEEESTVTPLACLVCDRLATLTLNSTQLTPIPDPWRPLLRPLFSGLIWIAPPSDAAARRFPVGLLQVSALFDALSRHSSPTAGEFR